MASTSGIRKRKVQLCEEPSTLVYTLLNPKKLPFAKFSLIIRSLHSYMVDDILPMPDSNCVHVKLNYQASVKNACAKLGPNLERLICVTKLSSFIKDDELSLLDELKREYGFGTTNADEKKSRNKKAKTTESPRGYIENTELSESDEES